MNTQKTLKTADLILNVEYRIICGKVIQTQQFGIKVLLKTAEGDYWLPNSYSKLLAADQPAGTTIPMDNLKMTFTGYKPDSLKTPILMFEEINKNE